MLPILDFPKKTNTNIFYRKIGKCYLQIRPAENGCWLEVVDENNQSCMIDPNNYQGSLRKILQYIESQYANNNWMIDWGAKDLENDNFLDYEMKIDLWKHQVAMNWLKDCDNLVNYQGQHIDFASEEGLLEIELKWIKDRFKSQVMINHCDKEWQIVSDEWLMLKDKLINVGEVGGDIFLLRKFNTDVNTDELALYLSIVKSYLPGVKLNVSEYSWERNGQKRVFPTLYFEHVDEDKTLYLKLGRSSDGISPEIFEKYDLTKIIEVDEERKILKSYDLSWKEVEFAKFELMKQIRQVCKRNKIKENFWEEDESLALSREVAEVFLQQDLGVLLKMFAMYGAEKLKNFGLVYQTPKLKLQLGSGIDYLEGEADLEFEDEAVNLLEALDFYQENNYIRLKNGEKAVVDADYMNRLKRIFGKNKKGEKVKLSFFDLPEIDALIEKKTLTEKNVARKFYSEMNNISNIKTRLPKNVNAVLRDYQKYGYRWMEYVTENNLGCCLADDMGLGKTLQVITLLARMYPVEKKQTLIIMPKSLLYNWKQEFAKFAPMIKVDEYYGKDRRWLKVKDAQVVLTTYHTARRDVEKLKEKKFGLIVLDESQQIKTPTSQISKAVILLQSDKRIALSGTPVENNVLEMYSLFRFLNPGMFGSADDFMKWYGIPIQRDQDEQAMNDLRKRIYPFLLRRTKGKVLTQLPEKIEQILWVEMGKSQRDLYEKRRTFYRKMIKQTINSEGINKSQFLIFQALNELRQIVTVPEMKSDNKITASKLDVLLEQVKLAVENGHKVLIFANFLAAIEGISQRLIDDNIKCDCMTGATQNRQKIVEGFCDDDEMKVLVMTLKTGGLGLNLTVADMVFIYDPWWNVAAENQAIDRTHRLGQENRVMAYKLITKGTIEEKILALQEKKKQLFNQLIESGAGTTKSLSAEDIDYIFGV